MYLNIFRGPRRPQQQQQMRNDFKEADATNEPSSTEQIPAADNANNKQRIESTKKSTTSRSNRRNNNNRPSRHSNTNGQDSEEGSVVVVEKSGDKPTRKSTARPKGKKRSRPTSTGEGNGNKAINDNTRGDGENENETSDDRYRLDGVDYESYNDFVAAKRHRNETYLKSLGFDTKTNKKSKPPKESVATETNAKPPSGPKENSVAETMLDAPSAKLISPVSTKSYYDQYQDDVFKVSFDGVSQRKDPYDIISNLLLQLEEDCSKKRKQSDSNSFAVRERVLRDLSNYLIPHSEDLQGSYRAAFHQLNGVRLILWILNYAMEVQQHDAAAHDNNDATGNSSSINNTDIIILCLQILCDASYRPPTKSGAQYDPVMGLSPDNNENIRYTNCETLALDVYRESGMDSLYSIARSLMEQLVDSIDALEESKTGKKPAKRKRTSKRNPSSPPTNPKETPPPMNDFRRRQTLQVLGKVWCAYFNLTYFNTVTAAMGKKALMDLADMAYWTVAALDYYVTKQLEKVLPKEQATSETTSKQRSNSKSKGKKTAATDVAMTSQEDMRDAQTIAKEASPILESVLGTLRNLVADLATKPLDWEAKAVVSKLLDIVCKGGGAQDHPVKPTPPWEDVQNKVASDLLFFWAQGSSSRNTQTATIATPKTPITTIFRWMEESESTVWELMGVFKVCIGKGILFNTHDFERLTMVWIRCLQQFGTSSACVQRVLTMTNIMVFPDTQNILYEREASTAVAGIRKQILLREGFLKELADLKRILLCRETSCERAEGEMQLRTQLEATISRISE